MPLRADGDGTAPVADDVDDDHLATDPGAVVRELRRTRKRRRLGEVEWFDVAYRVYLFALVGLSVVVWASDTVDGLIDDDVTTAELVGRGPAVLGCLVAVAVAVGLRSGSEGGPVSIEDADVRHLLLAPVPRRTVLARPVGQRLRSTAFALGLTGGVAGQLVATEMAGSRTAWAASGALFGALVAAVYVSAAMLSHVARASRWLATLIGVIALAWQAGAAWATWTGSGPDAVRAGPANLAGSVAFWGVRQRGIDVAAIAAIIVAASLAIWASGRLRVERLQGRAQLVTQLRFAATVQDLRTVVLLRRQLRSESLRTRPWWTTRGPRRTAGPGSRSPQRRSAAFGIWRRGLRSLGRLPAARLGRIAALAVAIGVAGALTVRSSVLFAATMVIAMFVLGLEVIEPLSQEIDHPTLTDSLPVERGLLYVNHLAAPGLLLAVAGLCGALAATIAEPSYAAAAFALAVPTAWAGSAGAVIATVRDAPPLPVNEGTTLFGMSKSADNPLVPPEFAGFSNAVKTIVPLAVTALAVVPFVVLRSFPGAGTVVRSVIGALLLVVVTLYWVRRRDRWAISIRRFFAEGREAYSAR